MTSSRASWTRGTSRWRWTAAWAETWAPTSCPTSSTRCRSGPYHSLDSHLYNMCFYFPQLSNNNFPFPLVSVRCTGCEAVLCGIEEQVSRANQYRESQLKVKVQVETEVRPASIALRPQSSHFLPSEKKKTTIRST